MNKQFEKAIDGLIDSILSKYTPAKYDEVRRRSALCWNGGYPDDKLVYAVMENPAWKRGYFDIPGKITSMEQTLLWGLMAIDKFADWDCDYYCGVMSGLKQVTLPSYFGCREIVSGGDTAVEPAFHTVDDIYRKKAVGVVKGTTAYEILENMAYSQERTHGLLPIYITDMQGPFSVAAQVYGMENFMTLLYDDPEAAKFLLQRCTDCIIEYFKKMKGLIGPNLVPLHCHPLLYMPSDKGVAVSDDFFAITSPEIVEEFSAPYLEQIGAEFGGIVVHSCGSIDHLLKTINGIKNLTGINFSSTESNLPMLAQKLKKDLTIICHNSAVTCNGRKLLSQAEQIEHCADVVRETGAKIMCIAFGFNEPRFPEECKGAFAKYAELQIKNGMK